MSRMLREIIRKRIKTNIFRQYWKGKTTQNINAADENSNTKEIYVVSLNGQKCNQIKNRKKIRKKYESKQKLIYNDVELQSVHDLMEIGAPRTQNYIETWHRR
ncbi:18143_t:CDS:2 [Rhizophagus irregularis]|nr:18143_t:CDS:2 [Rhizophagus irregularis]